ncbi:sensor histidine kinase [Ruminococcus albus]|uniref:Heme sensor protein HssS n=1 Tax=Ruminococcus albus 8 TaxID=246199 RepID=E9SDV5_RUMAL|nr:HAMP domain-containing sensor histidine kinase [Ruminococcus albus]EGC02688.1 ATPase/histidine kinase/DNA gyrase B/HSP90 domain protein [Ruminococcus albus 8]MBE6874030.1 HAMP domain-containing histidine kinase [Ruminococcus albus]MCC3350172.1 HAMP domain-containing histidine kinase [Ruminococcus albus 8]
MKRQVKNTVNKAVQNLKHPQTQRMTMQFKLAMMFFIVMFISASISVSVLLLIFSPIMRENSKTQLVSFANSATSLEREHFNYETIISLLNTPSYEIRQLSPENSLVKDHEEELEKEGYVINTEGIVPRAEMLTIIDGQYVLINSFNSENVYWVVNFVTIVGFISSILLGTIITTFVGRTMLQPIHDLSMATSEVARGNFSVRVRENGADEYGILQRNFNKMAQELSGIETLRGDFISNVSHEFKTPLASIQGFAKLLQDPLLSSADRAEYTQIIIDETSRLSKLSSNILSLTKLENQTTIGKKKRFRIDEQIRKIILMLEPEWSKKDIDMDIDLEDIIYVGNEDLMGQIWQNIINNAIKFTPQNGIIKVNLFRGGNGIVTKIWDNGPQIPADKKDKIFEKFYQGDRSRATEGNGLGLALVKRIVDLADGKISVDNPFEGGVVFTVELPYQTEEMM